LHESPFFLKYYNPIFLILLLNEVFLWTETFANMLSNWKTRISY